MGLRVLRRNSTGRFQKSIERLQGWQLHAALAKRLDDLFGGDVSYQRILRKRTAAQSAERRIETPAARVVGRRNLRRSLIGTAVQMDANFEVIVRRHHRADQVADL